MPENHQISRHSIKNLELILEEINSTDEELEEDFYYLQQNPENLGYFSKTILETASSAILVGLPHDKIINYMQIGLYTGLGHFQSALNPGKSFNIDLGNKKLSIQGVKTTAYIDTFQWERLLHIAFILREKGSIKMLNSILRSFMRQADIKPDDADEAIVSFYQGLYDSDVELGALLLKAMKACNPSKYEVEREDYLLYLKGAELSVYGSVFSDEPQAYKEKLTEAILDHKKYWGSKERAYDNTGWVSFPLTSACVVAYDNKGYEPEVDSPYVPLWLVKHEF